MTWQPGDPVRLETERFVLRTLGEVDVTDRYLGWLADPDVMRYVNARGETHTPESVRAYVAGHDGRTSFLLGVFTKDGGEHVGNHAVTCDLSHRTCTLGVLIGDRAWWGRDVVVETRAAVLDFLFGAVGMETACGECYAANAAAIYNYESLGFTAEEILRSHVVVDGRRGDAIQFAMRRDDWIARRADESV